MTEDTERQEEQTSGGTLRDQLTNALAKAREEQDRQMPEMEAAAPEEGGDEAQENDGRARDEHGRFVKAEGAAPDKATAEVKESAASEQDEPAAEQSSAPAAPPVSWSPEAKQEWAKLPPAIQAAVVKRESEVSDGFRQYGEKVRAYDDLEKVIAPRRKYYQESGRSDAELVNQLWLWNEALLNNPTEAFPALAKLFGYDLSKSGQKASQPSSEEPQIDPNIRTVIDPITGKVTQLERTLSTIAYQMEQERYNRAEAELSAWAKDKPHFAKVRPVMGHLMQAEIAKDLDEAYQMATRADPEIFAAMQAEEQAKQAQKKDPAQAAAASAKAKRAAVSLPGRAPTSGAGNGKPKEQSVRDSLMSAMAEHTA